MTSKTFLIWLSALVIALGLVGLRYPPTLSSDYSMMTLSWDHFRRTGEFDRMIETDEADIARFSSPYLTWWSPGPQVLTGSFEYLGLPIGVGIVAWACAGIVIQLAGYRRLLIALGYEERVIAWSLVATALGWHALYALRQFQGGETFAAALLPWLCLAGLKRADRPLGLFLALLGLGVLGAFLKLSFLISTAAVAGTAVLAALSTAWGDRSRTRRTALIGFAATAGLTATWAVVHWTFTSRGPTPASFYAPTLTVAATLHSAVMAFILPLCSMFALVSSVGRLCLGAGWPPIEDNPPILFILAAASATVYVVCWKALPRGAARAMTASFLGTYVVAFTILYAKGADVSFEDRHFRPIAAMLLPGFYAGFIRARGLGVKLPLAGLAALSLFWGVSSYSFRLHELVKANNRSFRGYSLHTLTSKVERAVAEIDAQLDPSDNDLVCSNEPEALLAVRNSRVSRLNALGSSGTVQGRVHTLVLVLAPGEAKEKILTRFAAYDANAWQTATVDSWTLCWQGADRIRYPLSATRS